MAKKLSRKKKATSKRPAKRVPKPVVDDDGINDATMLVWVTDDDQFESGAAIPPEYLAASTIQVEGGRKYDVDRIIAKGGMGIVYEARDINCDRTVALKVLLTDSKHFDENRKRFVSEAQITSKLEHPNIVPIHELGRDVAGNTFYSMKFIKGVTLGSVLNELRHGNREIINEYPLARLLSVFERACDAMAFAHAHSIVHRDLKPGNIMIGDYGEVLVLDWGLARPFARSGEKRGGPEDLVTGPVVVHSTGGTQLQLDDTTQLFDTIRFESVGTGLKTVSGTVLGTPGFMAPEQVSRSEMIDQRTDIYALGAILYSILTLRSPVREKNIPKLLRRILDGDIPPAVSHNATAKPGDFPHLPDGQVPAVLSEVARRAMEVDPGDRYQSIREFRHEIEDFQNGLVWHLVIDDDFRSPSTLDHWEPRGCEAEIRDGELCMHGGELQMLLLKRDLPLDVRIEFECHQEGSYLNDMACLLSVVRSDNNWETSTSGYAFKYGAYTNTLNVLTRCDVRVFSEQASPLAPGRHYKVRAERVGHRLRWMVDGKEVCTATDPQPLTGSMRSCIGLLGWVADTRFSRIRVYTLGTPWKSDSLDIAERHLHAGHYTTAMDLYEEVVRSFPDATRLERAQQGYDKARVRGMLQRSLPAWKEKLYEVWPGSGVEVDIDDDGLSIRITDAGIKNLDPLRGIPVCKLSCWGNRITSLEPLREMPLIQLNCIGNPIESLEPLRGMPLREVRCEACRVTSLEPLRGMPLKQLGCNENPLGPRALEPLKGMKLNWLACVGVGAVSLEPLRGMPLERLFCDGNAVEDLAPMAGMPLTEISFKGNRIVSLEPLKGLKINTLRCEGNRITSLAPLRGMPVTTFSCQNNRIASLEPLRDTPVTCMLCGTNELKDIGSFVKNPPRVFFFDCDSIPTAELEWIHKAWSRDFRLAEHVRHLEVILALRRGDRAALRERAGVFQGHRYLFVPKFLRWEEARRVCESVGGHLATIGSKEENEFVAALFQFGGAWFWIGLEVIDGEPRWVTGEPVTYRNFVTPMQEKQPGPRVLSSRDWCYDIIPNAHNCFIMEWDD